MDFDWLDLQLRAHREFSRGVDAVTDWSAPTPDTEWDVAALVRHVTKEQQWVAPLLAGKPLAEAADDVASLGPDLVAEWKRHSETATRAWANASPSLIVELSYGPVPVLDYLREQVSDVVIHSWDLARAIGADETLDETLVAATWTIFEPQRQTLKASGLFADPIDVDDTPPLQHRLLAITGRDPRGPFPR